MLGPHIFGGCLVTRLHMAMMALQSFSCSGLALDARYSSTLAPVGLVLVAAMGWFLGRREDRTVSSACFCKCYQAHRLPLQTLVRRFFSAASDIT